ncbi:DUF488 domain-containing protein [Xanthomarina sp. F1114]|uniref:DUF488 domain-containing protein n=1 Tax=Xanthomarina sp. F1114 TaxID=2996019 RepID=UPI00225E2455|nr:DUF488 domain-containing protein [Xanthomarina sp. F1114]MCX7548262.1 DUF488 domain-containing protein [Xanthomarina sp. F1114]
MKKQKTIWTIGHSTRTEEEFLNLLESFEIKQLLDVRRFPGSRKFPQFNKENLEVVVPKKGMAYIHLENLGGRRKASPESKNTIWNHPSFRGYADYMETDSFERAFSNLQNLALKKPSAIMCSEAVWWRCHRSMIADKLKAAQWDVLHILGEHKLQKHPYTKPAKVIDGHLSYQ